jgi:hypothetical protein
MNSLQFCVDTLATHRASESQRQELLDYNQNVFVRPQQQHLYQPQSEPHIAVWEQYVKAAATIGAYEAIKPHLVQLQFPIRSGISETESYRAATRKGKSVEEMADATGLQLRSPERLQLYIHQTLAGAIPVLVAGDRDDFISLVRALTKRNEPAPIPASMGACMVAGYNNWHRVHLYQQQWCEEHKGSDWATEWQQLIKRPHLYRDSFILLSPGIYSNVSAEQLKLDESEWLELSLKIRLEHECTHYITRRWFGSMRNNLLDELIADYRGIVSAIGYYRADWFLQFLGLESFPDYRQGGRLENYRGDPPLSDGAFKILQALVKAAAENLEQFEQKYRQKPKTGKEEINILIALTTLRLEELACDRGVSLLEAAVIKSRKSLIESRK